ncbi:hypothetical protein LX32DRAFT_209551 [Colletotrichum zoysiae]|uniref:Uncharacterized protein n=1 Tax=Colletotrichum zoysiae TaxID=1216348 RepID=A0AAD9HNL1_9PEZI|nr:hypothetical protein LX32DRAFT_209551 [Colletotrichum zoysiae]
MVFWPYHGRIKVNELSLGEILRSNQTGWNLTAKICQVMRPKNAAIRLRITNLTFKGRTLHTSRVISLVARRMSRARSSPSEAHIITAGRFLHTYAQSPPLNGYSRLTWTTAAGVASWGSKRLSDRPRLPPAAPEWCALVEVQPDLPQISAPVPPDRCPDAVHELRFAEPGCRTSCLEIWDSSHLAAISLRGSSSRPGVRVRAGGATCQPMSRFS